MWHNLWLNKASKLEHACLTNKHQNDKDAEMQPLLTIKKYLSATGDHLAIII
jgi:hypothetical protein